MPVHLAIDHGTSSTAALLSSAVCAEVDGRLPTGRDAIRAARLEPNPKRRIDEPEVLLGDRVVAVDELMAATLRRVVDEATRRSAAAGDRPDAVVVERGLKAGPTRPGPSR